MTTDKSPPGNEGGGVDDGDDLEMMQVTHDHLLKESVRITQPVDGYRVGTDAVLLAASINTDRGRILDLGTGVGGVALCIAHRLAGVQITAVEKDTDIAELADINITDNGFASRIRLIKGDVTALPAVLAASFDHVVSNPPYHDVHGTRPRSRTRALAHMGEDTSLEDWVKAAIWAAKPRARISFICRADRAAELITLFETHGAGETLVFPLWPRHASPAGRVIIQARRGVKGPGAILPGLVMHNDKGGYTEMASGVMAGDALFVIHPARPQATPN
jgi:tRNA1Val (adenine37-N6)-methyltransferase